MMEPSPRSYLFVPGNRPDRFDKAWEAGADALILDLEDSVPPAEKTAARARISEWLSPKRPVFLRVNGGESEWFETDAKLCALPGVVGVILPKAESAEKIRMLVAAAGNTLPVLPLIETAKGFWNALELARAQQVQRLIFGTLDFRVDLGIIDEELLYFRSRLVLVSRIAQIAAPVEGVTTQLDSGDRVRADTMRAKNLGFGGKLCIHPKQVPVVNQCFLPSAEEEAWARRIMEASASVRGAAVAMDGEMVDRPVLARAEAILARVERPRK
jgi:citrate lyase subunit beta / citryl-CoA lyase